MSNLKFHKVTSLPGTLEADAFYFVDNGTYAESYLTDSTATAHSIGNTSMIEAVAGPLITTELADFNSLEIVADIAARDALGLTRNAMVLVEDASADANVGSGAALYAYKEATTDWSRIAEYESLDIVLSWANISGKPSSSPANIDDAVTKRHTHINKSTLDKIGETGGLMTFDGTEISTQWNTLNW